MCYQFCLFFSKKLWFHWLFCHFFIFSKFFYLVKYCLNIVLETNQEREPHIKHTSPITTSISSSPSSPYPSQFFCFFWYLSPIFLENMLTLLLLVLSFLFFSPKKRPLHIYYWGKALCRNTNTKRIHFLMYPTVAVLFSVWYGKMQVTATQCKYVCHLTCRGSL